MHLSRPMLFVGLALLAVGCATESEQETQAIDAVQFVAAGQVPERDLASPCLQSGRDETAQQIATWALSIEYEQTQRSAHAFLSIDAPAVAGSPKRVLEVSESTAEVHFGPTSVIPPLSLVLVVRLDDKVRLDIGDPFVEIGGYSCQRVHIAADILGFVYRDDDGGYLAADDERAGTARRLIIPGVDPFTWPEVFVSAGSSPETLAQEPVAVSPYIQVPRRVGNHEFLAESEQETRSVELQMQDLMLWIGDRLTGIDGATVGLEASIAYPSGGVEVIVPLVLAPPISVDTPNWAQSITTQVSDSFEARADLFEVNRAASLVVAVIVSRGRQPLVSFDEIVFDRVEKETDSFAAEAPDFEVHLTTSLRGLSEQRWDQFVETGFLVFDLDERIFAAHFADHYHRQLLSVSAELQVVGPYERRPSYVTLTQTMHTTLLLPDLDAARFILTGDGYNSIADRGVIAEQLVSSPAEIQLSAGVFMPWAFENEFAFEGTGAIAAWVLQIADEQGFDRGHISDIEFDMAMSVYDGGVEYGRDIETILRAIEP